MIIQYKEHWSNEIEICVRATRHDGWDNLISIKVGDVCHLKPWRGLIANALYFLKKELKKQQDFQAQTETLELQNGLRGKKN